MNNQEYVSKVNTGEYPKDVRVPLDKPFEDERGVIQNVWLGNCGSVTYITSKAGSVRACHRHSDDWHGLFIIIGKALYIEIIDNVKHEYIVNENDMVFSKPDVYHEFIFLEDTKFITCNGILKNHINYENSVIRPEK